MPRPRSLRKVRAILVAALELFAEETYAACPIPRIATRAGVSAGTLYLYFASKEQLANVLYRRWKRALLRCLLVSDPQAPGAVQFRALWRRLCGFARRHPAALAFLETHHHAAYLDAESRALAARFDRAAESFVERLRQRGEVRDAPSSELITLAWGAYVALSRREDQWGEPLVRRSADAVWAMLVRSP